MAAAVIGIVGIVVIVGIVGIGMARRVQAVTAFDYLHERIVWHPSLIPFVRVCVGCVRVCADIYW